jgi:hypothetical protein
MVWFLERLAFSFVARYVLIAGQKLYILRPRGQGQGQDQEIVRLGLSGVRHTECSARFV